MCNVVWVFVGMFEASVWKLLRCVCLTIDIRKIGTLMDRFCIAHVISRCGLFSGIFESNVGGQHSANGSLC